MCEVLSGGPLRKIVQVMNHYHNWPQSTAIGVFLLYIVLSRKNFLKNLLVRIETTRSRKFVDKETLLILPLQNFFEIHPHSRVNLYFVNDVECRI